MEKTLVIRDGRTIVQTMAPSNIIHPIRKSHNKFHPIRKSHNKFANATVNCPCCGSTLLYADLCRQLYQKQKREEKYDRELLLTIIQEFGSIRTGELAREYEQRKGFPVPNRMLTYIITDFAEQGAVKTKIVNEGRFGRTKIITFTKGKEKTTT